MFNKAKSFVKSNKKKFAVPVGMAFMVFTSAVSAFAADGDVAASGGSAYKFTSSTLAPLTNAINDSLDQLIPVGITLMATMIGISLIRRVVYSFI